MKIEINSKFGYAIGEADEDDGTCELKIIHVPEQYQGKGHGRRILTRFIERALSHGFGITLQAEAVHNCPLNDAELTAFYARHGFVATSGNWMKYRRTR